MQGTIPFLVEGDKRREMCAFDRGGMRQDSWDRKDLKMGVWLIIRRASHNKKKKGKERKGPMRVRKRKEKVT